MALVSYDYDSNSENEEENEETRSCVVLNNEPSANTVLHSTRNDLDVNSSTVQNNSNVVQDSLRLSNGLKEQNTALEAGSSLFSKLPETKKTTELLEEDQIEDFIPRSKPVKVKEKVKITIPSLSEFNDVDDEPAVKKMKQSHKVSGLISLLPPVKGSVKTATTFVPNVVANKTKPASAATGLSKSSTSSLIPQAVRKQAEAKRADMMNKLEKRSTSSDIESDDEDITMPETFDDEMWQKVCGRPKPKPVMKQPEPVVTQTVEIAPEPEKPYEGLDNQAFKELVGRTKRPIGNIKLIDINEEDVLPEKELWLTKALTDPEMEPKKTIENPVDPTRRRKHHITYLAQQAKANEQELQNNWAASKNNRLASRAKYGF